MVKNIAHRGFSGKYPENTMLAFEKALEEGCDGIEFDVHLTADDVLVIIHDERVDRTTNGTGEVKDFSYKELRALDASADFAGVYGINRIPTLREYFDLVRDRKDLITNIEIKTGVYEYPEIERKVLEMIDQYGLRENIIISSFNHFTVTKFKELAPDVKVAFLEESWIINMGEYTKKHKVDCIHPVFWNLKPVHIAEMKMHGREINTWTVNEEGQMRDLIAVGVDGIITNYPDRLNEVLATI